MSLAQMYKDYYRERLGAEVLETDAGFIVYVIQKPIVAIQELYLKPEYRRERRATQLADRVLKLAREYGCTKAVCEVQLGAHNASDSMAAILSYGFNPLSSTATGILFSKEIF